MVIYHQSVKLWHRDSQRSTEIHRVFKSSDCAYSARSQSWAGTISITLCGLTPKVLPLFLRVSLCSSENLCVTIFKLLSQLGGVEIPKVQCN